MPIISEPQKIQALKRYYAQAKKLQAERAKLELSLLNFNVMVEGSLLFRRKTCGSQKCICRTSKNKRHGPYWMLQIIRDKKSRVIYIPEKLLGYVTSGVEEAKAYAKTLRKIQEITKRLDILLRKIQYFRKARPFRRGKDVKMQFSEPLAFAFIKEDMPARWKFKKKGLNWKPEPDNLKSLALR